MSDYFSNIENITQRIDTNLGKLPDQGFAREVHNFQTHCMDPEMEQKYYKALKDIEDIKGSKLLASRSNNGDINDRINLYEVVKSILSYVLLLRVFRLLRSSGVMLSKTDGFLFVCTMMCRCIASGAIIRRIISLS
jgi:hypothetical protein